MGLSVEHRHEDDSTPAKTPPKATNLAGSPRVVREGLLDVAEHGSDQGWGGAYEPEGDLYSDDQRWPGVSAGQRQRLQEYERQRPPHHGD